MWPFWAACSGPPRPSTTGTTRRRGRRGTLNSAPNTTYTVQLFSNPPGADAEGRTFIGQTSATTNVSGEASFVFALAEPLAAGQNVTATSPGGDTSEFSAPVTVLEATPPGVVRVASAPGATNVSPATSISAAFSKPMKASTVNRLTFTLRKQGTCTPVAATVSCANASSCTTAVLNPNANLAPGATYLATVTTRTRDLSDNALDQVLGTVGNQPKVWGFTVRR